MCLSDRFESLYYSLSELGTFKKGYASRVDLHNPFIAIPDTFIGMVQRSRENGICFG